jgi:glycerol uptake operon antiterminator
MNGRKTEELYPAWRQVMEEGHIIAAVRNADALEKAATAPTQVVYLLFGNPLTIGDMLRSMCARGKLPLVNLDLMTGFSRDSINAEYLAKNQAAGIVSTHSEVLRAAAKLGLITVQRTFALDSAAVEAGLRASNHFLPDAVEILPAVAAPRVAKRFREVHPGLRVVAGGLVTDLKEVESVLANGIDAISVSDSRFWV